tara:strand:- start:809 stop:1831 length:1023 start_codon:yes stop_codon:yes gene_type:complete
MTKKLVIINNEKCIDTNNDIYCQNIEIKSLSDNLSSAYDIKFLLRKSFVQPVYKIDKSNVRLSSNIFSFTKNLIISIFKDQASYLIISVTPYTFYSFIFLFLFRKKTFLYLRSNGKEEISIIAGKIFSNIYKMAENFMAKFSNLIVVNELISKKRNYFLVNPSQIDDDWLTNTKPSGNRDHIKLLYVGRLKVEKGIFSLINIFKKINFQNKKVSLTLVGQGKEPIEIYENIKFLKPISEKSKMIDLYDNHTILILPSFTEGHPQVLLESLSRQRPVIIFKEIKHVIKNYEGVFVCQRDQESLQKTIEIIDNNYEEIINKIKKNTYPTKNDFFKELKKILN